MSRRRAGLTKAWGGSLARSMFASKSGGLRGQFPLDSLKGLAYEMHGSSAQSDLALCRGETPHPPHGPVLTPVTRLAGPPCFKGSRDMPMTVMVRSCHSDSRRRSC